MRIKKSFRVLKEATIKGYVSSVSKEPSQQWKVRASKKGEHTRDHTRIY